VISILTGLVCRSLQGEDQLIMSIGNLAGLFYNFSSHNFGYLCLRAHGQVAVLVVWVRSVFWACVQFSLPVGVRELGPAWLYQGHRPLYEGDQILFGVYSLSSYRSRNPRWRYHILSRIEADPPVGFALSA
jgi:hypothetical protein